MKTTLTILLIALCISVAGQTKSPEAWYKFESTNTYDDASGNGHTALPRGDVGYDPIYGGIWLGGTDDYVTIPAFDKGTQVIISLWYRASTTISTYKNLFTSADKDSVFYARGLATNTVKMYTDGNSVNPGVSTTINDWHHIVCYYNKTSGIGRMWHDNSRIITTDSILNTYFDSKDSMYIGVDIYRNADWVGNIGEIMIFSGFAPSNSFVDSIFTGKHLDETPRPDYYPEPGKHVWFPKAGVRNMPLKNGIPLYAKRKYSIEERIIPVADSVEILLCETFETWLESDVDSKAALSAKLPMSIQNYNGASYHSIVNTGGENLNAWQITMPKNGHIAYNGYIHLGDTARELRYQYQLYVQSNFNKISTNGIGSGKMPGGFAMGSSISAKQDTVNVPGLAGHIHNVWGTQADMMLYSYDHDNFGYAFGGGGTWPIPRGYWQTKTIRLNVGDPGQHNGFAEMYIDGVLEAQWTGLKFRSITQGEDFGKIEALFNSYQFGGGDTYLSPQNQYIRLDNLIVYKVNPGSNMYISGPASPGTVIPLLDAVTIGDIAPNNLLINETYTNASDTIYDVGNDIHYIYNVPNSNELIEKTVSRPSGNISFTFLREKFGYANGGDPYYVAVYSGSVAPENLEYTFGNTNDGYTNPSGTYTITDNVVIFVFRIGNSNYDERSVAIRYWQP